MTVKENSVFKAIWRDPEKSNHCFEGLLIAKQETDIDGVEKRIILVDTYWDCGANKWFTIKEALEQLHLTYYCNLDDFDLSVNVKNAPTNYEEHDYVYLHSQHQCTESCRRFYIKKGAIKSSVKMAASILNKIEKHERDIRYAQSAIEWLNKDLEKVRQGQLNGINI